MKQHALYEKARSEIYTVSMCTTTIRCWPVGRKDMHIYGNKGYIYQDTPTEMRVYADNKEAKEVAPKLDAPYNDSFYFLKAAVRKEIPITPNDLSSLENNLIVVDILSAAIESAKTGKVIRLD